MYTATSAPPNSGMRVPTSPGVSRVTVNGMTSQSVSVNSHQMTPQSVTVNNHQMSPHVKYPPQNRQQALTHAHYMHQQQQFANAAAGVRMVNNSQVPRTIDASSMASRHLGLPATPGRPTSTGYLAVPARASNNPTPSTIPMTHRQRLPHPSQMMEKANIKQVPATHPQAYPSSGPAYTHPPPHGQVHSSSHARTNSVQAEHFIQQRTHDAHSRFHGNVIASSANAQRYLQATKGVPMSAAMSHQHQRMTFNAQGQGHRGHLTAAGHAAGHTAGHATGHATGHTTRHAAGHAAGHATGHATGHVTGHATGQATGHATGHTSQGRVMSGQGLVSVYTTIAQHSTGGQQPGQMAYAQSVNQSKVVRPSMVSQQHTAVNHPSTRLRTPHSVQGAMGPAYSRPRPRMPPLIKAAPPELPAQSSEDAPLDLSNPDGPLDLSVKSRKRAASPVNNQDDVILVKVSQPKMRRLEQTSPGNYPPGYMHQSKYPHEAVYNTQSGANGKLIPTTRRLSQASPQQMMMSPSLGHPGVMQHHMMQGSRHPGPQQMSPGSQYDLKWRMASPQPKDINGNLYMTQGHMDTRVDAKRQSDELLRNAFNMRFANGIEGYKRSSSSSIHDSSNVPSHSNGYSKPAENQAQHSQSSPRALSEYRPLMQAGQPRTLEELNASRVGRRASLVTYNASPHALPNNSGYSRGSITQGLPMTERSTDQRGSLHQVPSQQPCDFASRKDAVPAQSHSAPHNQSEFGQNYALNKNVQSEFGQNYALNKNVQSEFGQNYALNKNVQGHQYPHSIPNNARPVVSDKVIAQSPYPQTAHPNESKNAPSDVQSHPQSHPYHQSGSQQTNQEMPSGRRPSLSTETSNNDQRDRSNQLNIIRIMHDFIETRIEDPTSEMSLQDPAKITEAPSIQPKQENTDQHHAVSHMGLPSGVRFHPSPEGVPRAPFKGERSHPDRTIPVANVNPILQSNNPLLHPKKQMLYQSRLESSRKEASTPIKDSTEDEGKVNDKDSKNDIVTKSSPGATCDPAVTENTETKKSGHEASKAWRKMHMVPIKERFKSKKMYNKEQALQSIKSEGSKIRSKVPGRKPGRPRSVAPLMKKATKAMKQQMMGRPGKTPGNDVTKSSGGDSPEDGKAAVKSEFDFVSNEKEENEKEKDTKIGEGGNLLAGNKMKKLTIGPAKRGRPRTRSPKKTSEKEEKLKNRKGKHRKEHRQTESGSEVKSRRGLHKRDLTVLTRHQAANVRSTRLGTLYNKNEAYEKELRRDEYRKFLLRIKRQTSWSKVSSRRKSLQHFQARSSGSGSKHMRKLRPRNLNETTSDTEDDVDRNEAANDDEDDDDDDARDADYDDTDLEDTDNGDDDEDGDDDDTEPASDTDSMDLPKRAKWQQTEKRKRKYKLRGRRKRIQDDDSDDAMPEQLDGRGQDRQPEVGQEVKAEVKKFAVSKDIGETLLHRAAKLGNMDLLTSCLQSPSVNVNARDNAGYTPLHESCVKGHLDVTRMLIAHGADVNANAIDGTRPIHDAVDNERFEIARLLLSCGADIRLASVSGRSVLKVARTDRMKTLIKGYLHDLNGPDEEEDEGEEPVPWTFHASSSILGRISNSGFDVLADVPSESEGDDTIFFDLNDKEHLPTFNLCLDKKRGYTNYHCLEDVLSTGFVNNTRKSINSLNLTIHRVERLLVADDMTRQGSKTDATASSSDDMSSFVEIDDTLLALLKVECFRIHYPVKLKGADSQPKECSSEKCLPDGVKNNEGDTTEAKDCEKNINKPADYPENDLSHGNNVCQSDKVKHTPMVKQEVAPSTVSPRQEVTSPATSPKARSFMPPNKAAPVPAKLQESKRETIVKSVSLSALDKYDLKTAYGMWNIKPCSVPIQNSGANFMVGKSGIVAHSQDKYSQKNEGRAKFQTKITDYDKFGKQSTNETKSVPAKASPHRNNSSPPAVSNCTTPASSTANKSSENLTGSNVNITPSSSTVPNNVALNSSQGVTGNEMDNVSTSASTISSGTTGSNMIKTEIKIGTVPEDCLAELAQVTNRRQSCCEQRSVSPREAATPTSAQIAVKPEPLRPLTAGPSDLPVLEKESSIPQETVKEEKPSNVGSVPDDREMPELTIEKSQEGDTETPAKKSNTS